MCCSMRVSGQGKAAAKADAGVGDETETGDYATHRGAEGEGEVPRMPEARIQGRREIPRAVLAREVPAELVKMRARMS